MLSIVCVQVDNYCGRGAEYVEKLYAAVQRFVKLPFRFVCITDAPIEGPRFDWVDFLPAEPGLTGWWQKLALFKPGKLSPGRAIFFDLDTVLLKPFPALLEYRGDFAMLSDLYAPERPASGVMAWRVDGAGAQAVWKAYQARGRQPSHRYGDGGWIGEQLDTAGLKVDRLQDFMPGIHSFKVCQRKYGHLLPTTQILCFHGQPRPHETHVWDAQ